jgi:tRNA(Ile)-lysidine synthase
MLQPHDSVLVGVSGGPDSIALLHALIALAPGFQVSLGIAHLDHSLRRKASYRDAAFVSSLAQNLDLPVYSEKVDVKGYQRRHRLSPEEAGRRLRYIFYRKIADQEKYNKLAIGHHADDNAESILMHAIRGTGPLGLAGIPPVRDGWIIRPLIKTTRSEILNFLKQNDLIYVTDVSNQNVRYLRNHIRHRLIPYLEENYHPKVSEALNRLGAITRDEENWQEEMIGPLMASVMLSETPELIEFSIPKLTAIHMAAKRRILRKAITRLKGSIKRISFLHVDAIVTLAEAGPCFGRLDLPAGLLVRRDNDRLVIEQQADRIDGFSGRDRFFSDSAEKPLFEYRIIESETTVSAEEAGVRIQLTQIPVPKPSELSGAGHHVAFFDISRISFPMVLRSIRPGDRFVPLGMDGTQKVKKFFINNKIPRAKRLGCPVLVSGGKIIWLVGHRIDDSVKVTRSTQNVLKVELFIA